MPLYNTAKSDLFNANVDFASDTIKVALATSSYTPNIDTHDFFDDITNEVTGTGYTAGGETLASKAITVDTTNDRAEFDAADTQWTSASFTARYAIIYKDTGVAGTSNLIAYIDFSTDQTVSSGTFTITWDSEGILQIG